MNTIKTGVFMAALFGLAMGLGQLLGGAGGLVIGFLIALGTNFFAYWFSDRVALSMSGAQEIHEAEAPGLFQMVRELTRRGEIPMPRLYIIPSDQPNAFATGRNPSHSAVAVTQGLLSMLSEDELRGVIAHELAHIKHRDILISSIAATIAGVISMVAQIFQYQAIFGHGSDSEEGSAHPLAILFGILVAPFAALLIQMAISRTREFEADKRGAEMSEDPLGLAYALKKIERVAERAPMAVNPSTAHMYIINPLGGDTLRSLANLFRTHPPTQQRIAKLEALAQRR